MEWKDRESYLQKTSTRDFVPKEFHLLCLSNLRRWNRQCWKNSDAELVFMIPQGFCMKPKQMKKGLNYRVTAQSFFVINDPDTANKLRLTEMKQGRLYLGPSGENTFSGSGYEIKINVKDSSIDDGKSCTDYKRIKTTYGECIETALMKNLIAWYGCLPPWFPAQNKTTTCGAQVEMMKPNEEDASKAEIQRLKKGFELESSTDCLTSCKRMSFEIRRLYSDPYRNGLLIVRLNIDDL